MKTKKDQAGNKDWLKADVRVLAHILAAQNIEFALPHTPHIPEFIANTLITIPGIKSCRVCLEDVSCQRCEMNSGICEECQASRKKAVGQIKLPSDRHDFRCSLADQPDMQFIAVNTLHYHFGFFVFQMDDPDIFNVYKPFISNFANYVAISLENRLQSDLLKKAHDELELRISEQAEELRSTNEYFIKEITVRQQTEESLRKSEEKLRAFFSQTIDGCFYIMLDEPVRWDETVDKEQVLDYVIGHQRVAQINDAMLSHYGTTREQIIDLVPYDFFEHNRDMWRRLLDAGKIRLERYVRKFDGTPLWIEGEYMVLYDSQGWIIGHFGIQRDITAHKRADEVLRLASLYSRKLIETSLDPLVMISKEGNITDVNTATERITGVRRETLIGSDFANYFTEPEMARAGYLKVFEQGQMIDLPLAIRHTSGSIAEVLFNASVYRNEQGEVLGVFAAARDITERKRVADELNTLKESLVSANLDLLSAFTVEQKLANTDALTGIYNRRYLLDLAEKEIAIATRYQQPLAVMMFDLDHFKEINDSYGHVLGDQMLQRVTQDSCTNMRTADVIGRYGGDEFVIVLPMTNAQQGYTLAERIRAGVAGIRVPTEKGDATVTLSIGIVEMIHNASKSAFESHAETVESMFRHADEAMYTAKKAGRNCTKIYSLENSNK